MVDLSQIQRYNSVNEEIFKFTSKLQTLKDRAGEDINIVLLNRRTEAKTLYM